MLCNSSYYVLPSVEGAVSIRSIPVFFFFFTEEGLEALLW